MILPLAAMLTFTSASAQLYTGMTGLVHVPSAEMNGEGVARAGVYFLSEALSPGTFSYPTMSHYLSITPFRWVEAGYTCTLFRVNYSSGGEMERRYDQKDRYFSLKINPLRESRYFPAIAIGSNDPLGSPAKRHAIGGGSGAGYFCNYYISAVKHLTLRGHTLALHLAWRRWKDEGNAKWNGPAGGITYRPRFAPNVRAIAEYDGAGVNVGADCLLWRHLLFQVSLQDGKHLSGGVCFQTDLL